MQLSIIILNYNVCHFLQLCLTSVQSAIEHIDAEVIVVDNNSTDGSCDMMKSTFPNVKLIENKQNFGFPKGNNIGVAISKGEFICILNPDTVVAEDTFTKIIAHHKTIDSKVGIIGCRLIDGGGNFLPESKRGTPTPFVAFTKIFGLYKFSNFFDKYYAQHLNQFQSGEVEILVGAFMFMKRDLYLEIGGFDEKCFMYSDDIDLSYMVLQKGLKNFYFHETTIIHFKGESTIKDETYMKRFQQAMNFFYKKHFKISAFFSLFMSIGIVLFSFIKKFQGKPRPILKPLQYVLLSSNENLKNKLQTQLKSEVLLHNTCNTIDKKHRTEIIFDNDFINFAKIIQEMNDNKNHGFTFKIIPKNANFMIGSNSSNDRGEVLLFNF